MPVKLPGKHPAKLALNEVLQDGAWHTLSEFLIVVRPLITPERASRAWLHEEHYRITRRKTVNTEDREKEVEKTPHAMRVARGIRRFTTNSLSRLVGGGFVERVKLDGINTYRLIPKE
jgi:hypothetical protein